MHYLTFSAGIFLLMMGCDKDYDSTLRRLYRFTVPLISTDSLADMLDSDSVYLLDIRSREEYEISHIEGAQYVDYEGFKDADVLHIPREAKVVLYCSVGYRSERIGERMLALGYTDVNNLYGGIFQWKNQDRNVVNLLNQPTDSVHAYNRTWSVWLNKGIKVY